MHFVNYWYEIKSFELHSIDPPTHFECNNHLVLAQIAQLKSFLNLITLFFLRAQWVQDIESRFRLVGWTCFLQCWHIGKHHQPISVFLLTHWGRDWIDAIFQTTFSNGFSGIKMFEFQLIFHWNLLPRVQLKYTSVGSDNGSAPSRQWTNDG